MRVTDVRCYVLLDPSYDAAATSSAQDDIVVEIHTDAGIVGIGESDVNPWIARACIEAPGTHTMDRGLGRSLMGLDPLDLGVWDQLYVATAMTGRRGALIHALGAIDMALWDIRGKAAGVPCWQLLDGTPRDRLPVYASLQPEVGTLDGYLESLVEWAKTAQDLGFTAAKLETTFSGPYANMGLSGSDESMTQAISAVRDAVGPGFTLMVDVQYAFDDRERALRLIESWADLDLFFVEAPLWADDLDGYAWLCERSPIPIAAGEWLATRHEFNDLVRAGVQVLQPDVGRVGGLTEAVRVCKLAADCGRMVVPHLWKTGITVAATAHLATVTANMPFFEYLPPTLCESNLRKQLVHDEIELSGGTTTIPGRPGLGVEVNHDARDRFAAAATRLANAGTQT